MKTRLPATSQPQNHRAAALRPEATAAQRAPAPDTQPDTQRDAAQRARIGHAFGGQAVQRAAEEDELQMKADTSAQRAALEEEEPLQGRFVAQRVEEEEPLQGRFEAGSATATATANHTGMPDALKSGVEALSGMDLSDVRVHSNSSRPAQLNAHAFAQGNDIHVAPGQDQHLAHEAWHVVQQRQGRVQANMDVGGVPVNDNPALEAEADVMGARASQLVQQRR